MQNKIPSFLSKMVRDPLVHFLILGGLIYAAYDLNAPPETETGEPTIVVSKGEIDWFKDSWAAKWNRQPTEAELDGLIRQHIKETALYREALSMGLDEDDVVIRRRLAQKVEFLTNDLLQPAPPSDEELAAFFEENKARYTGEDLITMTHVFFDPDKRGNATLMDADKVKATLTDLPDRPLDAANLGDPFLLQSYYPQTAKSELAKLFGTGFADPVFELEKGVWHGPVLSGYGTHLVYVHERLEAPVPELPSIREAVLADWQNMKRQELNEEFITQLVKRYKVVIENEDQTAQSPSEKEPG